MGNHPNIFPLARTHARLPRYMDWIALIRPPRIPYHSSTCNNLSLHTVSYAFSKSMHTITICLFFSSTFSLSCLIIYKDLIYTASTSSKVPLHLYHFTFCCAHHSAVQDSCMHFAENTVQAYLSVYSCCAHHLTTLLLRILFKCKEWWTAWILKGFCHSIQEAASLSFGWLSTL